MGNKPFLLLSFAGILWGIQPIFVKIVVAEMTPATLISVRYLFLSGTLFIIMKLLKEKRFFPPKECWFTLILMGLTGVALNNGSQFSGLQFSSVANATLIATLTPAITASLAAIFLHERLNFLQCLGIFISLIGTLYLISNGSLSAILNTSFNIGDILFFIAQTMWAIYCLLSIKVMKKMSVFAVTAWAGIFGGIFMAIYGMCTTGLSIPPLSTLTLCSMAFIIWLGGVGALVAWNLGVKYAGASSASIFLNLMPIVGIVAAAFTLGEVITIDELLGAVVILSGVYITTHSTQILNKIFHHKVKNI